MIYNVQNIFDFIQLGMIVVQMYEWNKNVTTLVLTQNLPWKIQKMAMDEKVAELSECKNSKILTDVTTQSWP